MKSSCKFTRTIFHFPFVGGEGVGVQKYGEQVTKCSDNYRKENKGQFLLLLLEKTGGKPGRENRE